MLDTRFKRCAQVIDARRSRLSATLECGGGPRYALVPMLSRVPTVSLDATRMMTEASASIISDTSSWKLPLMTSVPPCGHAPDLNGPQAGPLRRSEPPARHHREHDGRQLQIFGDVLIVAQGLVENAAANRSTDIQNDKYNLQHVRHQILPRQCFFYLMINLFGAQANVKPQCNVMEKEVRVKDNSVDCWVVSGSVLAIVLSA